MLRYVVLSPEMSFMDKMDIFKPSPEMRTTANYFIYCILCVRARASMYLKVGVI